MGINNGLHGLLAGSTVPLDWMTVNGWAKDAGAFLGTRRLLPKQDFHQVAKVLEGMKLRNLVMVGGWDGYEAIVKLLKLKDEFPFLQKMSFVIIPASISNNLPCTDICIGCDTALNNIVEAVDKIKQSAVSSRYSRV